MEFDQEKYLDEAYKVIKVQAYHLNKMIDNNNLKQALKESAVMLAELKTSLLTPRNYYSIFTLVLDELQFLEQFFKEENRKWSK
jgi:vacuolar protein sorting-associated protein 35